LYKFANYVNVQIFGIANNVSGFASDPSDGVIGLGFSAFATTNAIPIVQNLLPTFARPLFTIWLNRFVPFDHVK
jgi:hypothetical protein